MQKVEKIWVDGKLINWDDANVHVLTHTLHYGAGVFEGIRFYETENAPAVFRLKEHIDRLFFSAKTIGIDIPYSHKQLLDATVDLIKVNNVPSGYIRPLVYYGYGKMGIDPGGAPTNVTIAIWPWGSYLGEKPANCKISKYIRIHPKSTINEAKICGHYVNSILARLELQKDKHDEVILFDHEGHLAEGSAENIFIVKNGKLFTPKLGSILSGITRGTVLSLAKDENIPCEEKHITKSELLSADEAFFTGTAVEISPIGIIDDKPIGNGQTGPITEKIKTMYSGITCGSNKKYHHWLTFAN